MDLVQRAKNILASPQTEWPVIAVEPTTQGDLITAYVIPLSAIGAIAGFIGSSIIGATLPFMGTYRLGVVTGLVAACLAVIMAVISIFVLSLIINALAPTFGGQQNSVQAMKVAAYSYTAAWVAGVARIFPILGGLIVLIGALYSLYLLYLGLPVLMKNPADKSLGYTVVIVVCAIVVGFVLAAVSAAVVGAGMIGASMNPFASAASTSATSSASSGSVTYDKNSALGKLQELGNKLEENNKKIDAAEKSGDQAGAAAAAMNGLGILMGGGHRYDPVDIAVLKPLVPETFLGLPKTSSSAEKNGIAGLMVSGAKASYGDGNGKSVDLEITDTGGASGLVGLAAWAGVEGEREDDQSRERTTREGGRLVHERASKTRGGSNEYDVIVGDRFVVKAESNDVDLDQLKSAVAGLDLSKLESMKDSGMQK
jgi:hypothetical protein